MSSEYHRGEMDIHEQEATFKAFGALTKWGSLACAEIILIPTVGFCTDLGFGTAFVFGIILAAAGIFFLRDKPAAH